MLLAKLLIFIFSHSVLGGLAQGECDNFDDFSKNKEMRHARVEVLFRDYEVHIY